MNRGMRDEGTQGERWEEDKGRGIGRVGSQKDTSDRLIAPTDRFVKS